MVKTVKHFDVIKILEEVFAYRLSRYKKKDEKKQKSNYIKKEA